MSGDDHFDADQYDFLPYLDPEWNAVFGFEVAIGWECGCEFEGHIDNPASFKKRCFAHARPIKWFLVKVARFSMEIADDLSEPASTWYSLKTWPRGSFSLTSTLGIRRMQAKLNWLHRELRKNYDPENALLNEVRAAEDQLAAAIARRRPRETAV